MIRVHNQLTKTARSDRATCCDQALVNISAKCGVCVNFESNSERYFFQELGRLGFENLAAPSSSFCLPRVTIDR